MSNPYYKDSLLRLAQQWPLDHLNNYVKQLESQVVDIKELVRELKKIQATKQKEVNRKLRDSGTRGAT